MMIGWMSPRIARSMVRARMPVGRLVEPLRIVGMVLEI
jgi:hypothetical protein